MPRLSFAVNESPRLTGSAEPPTMMRRMSNCGVTWRARRLAAGARARPRALSVADVSMGSYGWVVGVLWLGFVFIYYVGVDAVKLEGGGCIF